VFIISGMLAGSDGANQFMNFRDIHSKAAILLLLFPPANKDFYKIIMEKEEDSLKVSQSISINSCQSITSIY
jgi:hypothetical protein